MVSRLRLAGGYPNNLIQSRRHNVFLPFSSSLEVTILFPSDKVFVDRRILTLILYEHTCFNSLVQSLGSCLPVCKN
jgi:hypothetical protein